VEQLRRRHDHAGRAITALQSVFLPEAFLDGMQFSVMRQSFDRRDRGAVGLNGKYSARLHCLSVEQHGTSAAERRFATDVCSRRAEDIAQVVDEQHAWLDLIAMRDTIHAKIDSLLHELPRF